MMSRREGSIVSVGSISKVAVVAIVLSGYCFAQFSAGVQGTIQDPSGARISKAAVILLNTATQISLSATSNDSGTINFSVCRQVPIRSRRRHPASLAPRWTLSCRQIRR